ncbi:MAG: porin [Glaciimonas sp.]|nr:porin [Glaciimonas sp.]
MAAAQSSVTVYGNLDVGVLTQNHAPAGTASTTMANGGISPSIWGFRGTEDLGDGLKANFNLEGHFAPDTGALVSGANLGGTGTLFRRQANVGLSSASLGAVTVGNQYSPAILAFAATDPRGLRENFSGLYSWAYNSGIFNKVAGTSQLATTPNTNNDVGVFLQNAISYSNTIGPVGVAAGYSLSERTRGAVYSLGVTYSGPVSLSAAYQSNDKPNTSDRLSSIYTVGAGYTMGAFTAKLNYLRGVNKDTTTLVETSRVDVFGLGVDWKMAANNTVIAAAYFGKDKDNSADNTKTLVLSDEYALSKRTTLYGQLAYARADAGASMLTTVVASGNAANTNTTLLNFGIKHAF